MTGGGVRALLAGRIAAWGLALGVVGGWKYWERKKEREFSASEAQQWNQDVLSKAAAAKARKQAARARKKAQRSDDEDA